MINNSAADYSILLTFDTEFDHVTPDQLQTFKIKESKVKVTT